MIGYDTRYGNVIRMSEVKKRIRSYQDLDVYQSTYHACVEVITQVLPALPKEERFDLVDQLRRSTKAIPRLIAEGFAKRHQSRGFQKYLDDAMAEANESVVGLSQCRDLYGQYVDGEVCIRLIDVYDKAGRQLYKLAAAWDGFTHERRKTNDETGIANR